MHYVPRLTHDRYLKPWGNQIVDEQDYVTVCVPARLELLNLVRTVIAEVAEDFGFAEGDTAQIVMAVDEACTNVLQHGYGGEPGAKVYVRTVFARDRLMIEILDGAERFSPLEERSATLDEFLRSGESHGFGLYVIQTLMDEIDHEYVKGRGNRLRLVKVLPVATEG